MSKPLVLSIELVPQSCWFSNVRSAVSKKQWDLIRSQTYSAAYDLCQICGGAGSRHPVECHEIWEYNDIKKIRKLVGMIALCPNCHQVKHIGLAGIRGDGEKALSHFMKINKLKRQEAEAEIAQAFNLWECRSQHKWTLDISHLETYDIDISKLAQPKNPFNYRKK